MNPAITKTQAKRLWIEAQRLNERAPFGAGPAATRAAVEHLGYIQIDTISVVERCHHHILFSRIPAYRRQDLRHAQTVDKSVFEYWTHALAYVPTRDFHFFGRDMRRRRLTPSSWYDSVKPGDLRRMLARIRREGAISMRDIDEERVEKDHAWASPKPSKRVLQLGFDGGQLTISERLGMLKKYELTARHFGWDSPPKAATPKEVMGYLLERGLRSQGLVSLDSLCHLSASRKPDMRRLLEKKTKAGELVAVRLEGAEKSEHWLRPDDLGRRLDADEGLIHILSPFDPLIIQRKRLKAIFDYEHLFEAYVPKEKRVLGYFALPVLAGDRIVAALDLKADRQAGVLRTQKWTWRPKSKSAALKAAIEDELDRFERFQLASE